ncbi:MAG: isocitrate/isopropylmalate dehydrogenase family protein [Thermoproteota archaeon]|nr:isocitrate/isopropylmalate dehydrogenase family protein [Thermoproteota archaeon]
MTHITISLINGDGIGPELANSAISLLTSINDNCSDLKFKILEVEAGDNAKEKYGVALPDFSFDAVKKSDACLKAPVGEYAADVILVLRRYFDLFANVRPARSYPNVKSLSPSIDLVTVRENTEDVYLGWEFAIDDETVIALRLTTAKASNQIAEYAFREAMRRNKGKKVVAVHKANVMRKGDGLFASICRKVASKYPEINYSELYVDACAMNLIRNPEDFDVILTSNLFGDIISDEAAQVVGGLGLGPAANVGQDFALFEPVHGAAFDIANKNIANPSSIFLSIKLMFEWLAERNEKNYGELTMMANHIENVLVELLRANIKTRDIGGTLHTDEFTKEFLRRMF